MLMINLPESTKITITTSGLTGNKSSYTTIVMNFLDMLEYKYAFIAGEIHLIDKIYNNDSKENLSERFKSYILDRGLPSWLRIQIE